MKLSLLFVSALLSLAAAACSSAEQGPPGPVVFIEGPTTSSEGATVYLRRAQTGGDKLVLEVVAKGAPDLYGAAFRLGYDPEMLALGDAGPSSAWPAGALLLSKEATKGQLLFAYTAKGKVKGFDATS